MVSLAEEAPFAAVVSDTALDVVCSSCFAKKKAGCNLARCIGCHVLYYCNKECQQKDWVNHKSECRLLKNSSPQLLPMMCRLTARVIFKLERSDAKDPAFNGRRFEDLLDHRGDMHNDAELMEDFASLSITLNECMADKHIPRRDVLLSIFAKIFTNHIGIGEQSCFSGIGVFVGLSVQNHSCDPDAYFVFDGNKAILRSIRANEYSKDITVSYIDLLSTNRVRQEQLRCKYHITCACKVCSDPSRDFLTNSVCSTCCPDSYCLLDPNANELICFKCGTPSMISVDEAILANQEVSLIFEEIEEEHKVEVELISDIQLEPSDFDSFVELEELIDIHEIFAKLLSPLKVNLLRVTDKIFELAYHLDDKALCLKHAPSILLTYKKYLSVGDPVLAVRLMSMVMAMIFDPVPTRKVLELLEEALATSKLTFDPRSPHSFTESVEEVLPYYIIKLERGIIA